MNAPQPPASRRGPRCAHRLVKRYGELAAVDGLDLEIAPGEFLGLLGPNGSGKTTTLHMLATLVRPSAGSASVAGFDVAAEPVACAPPSVSCSRTLRSTARSPWRKTCASPACSTICLRG